MPNASLYDEPQHDPISTPPSGISGKPTQEIVEAVEAWFGENFEDPVHNTPFDDGEYVYIWGGPYETRDIVENIFADELTDEEIEAVTEAMDSESLEWVPHIRRQRPPDDEDGSFGVTPPAKDLHARMLALIIEAEDRLRVVSFTVANEQPPHGIGHNKPPESINDAPITPAEVETVRAALSFLKAQPVEADTEGQNTAKAANEIVQSTSNKIANWAKDRASDFAAEFFKELGKKAAGAISIYTLWQLLGSKLAEVAHAVSHWLVAVHPPF